MGPPEQGEFPLRAFPEREYPGLCRADGPARHEPKEYRHACRPVPERMLDSRGRGRGRLCPGRRVAGPAADRAHHPGRFFLPGSQPNGPDNPIVLDPFVGAMEGNCVNCHADFIPAEQLAEPFRHWVGSMMAQAYRDPMFQAAMTVANPDAAFFGDLCLRCHTPAGWLGGRSVPTDGSALSEPADFEGATCHFCHRMVDPFYVDGQSPSQDVPILDDLDGLGVLPLQPGDGRYVLDPDAGVRRGPRDGINHPQGAEAIFSPFHTRSDICATCHDVSNPVFSLQPGGTYLPNDLGAPHPTMDKYEMFPVERTYSEWSQSQFAAGGVELGGRFGGNHPTGIMESCQDCHMPDQIGPGCATSGTVRPDAPQHALNGGNTWVLHAVRSLYPDSETGLTDEFVQDAQDRIAELLRDASDLELTQEGGLLRVRVINYSGHKLPSGYPEGRRMWVNVRFLDPQGELCAERGAYDFATATLTTADTRVYEAKLGLDAAMAAITGLPAGESFHFALANTVFKDNRIPPIGFTNAGFEGVQAGPVAHAYADGQYWDDTLYEIPSCAAGAVVTVFYQTTSKEYVEFLLAENTTDERGQIAYDQWLLHGMSAPLDMDSLSLALEPPCPWDLDGSGDVGITDLLALLAAWGTDPGGPPDFDGDGSVGITDLLALLAGWGPCPGA